MFSLCYFQLSRQKEDVDNIDPFRSNTKYCHYDEAHNDYLFKEEWSNFIMAL
jgi:hypothetical protein